MKIVITVLLLAFSFSQGYPQSSDSLNYCISVLNDSGMYVSGVGVRIVSFKKIDAFEKGAVTDSSGTACFSLAYGRDYNLIINDSLYTRIKKKITFDAALSFLSDTVVLSSRIASTDVINVEAEKDFMHVEDDKIVFDISKMKTDPGPNALELMKKIPMVSVEGDNVYLRGNPPKILVNGRESEIYGDLKSIPVDLIEKVEVMTVAPSKYEAEGSSGVINVILKKFEEAKYRVFLSGWGSSNSFGNLNQNLNYKKDKVSLFFNMGERLYFPNGYNYGTTRNLLTGEINVSSYDTNKNNSKSLRINPGVIYDVSGNLYFGVEGVFNMTDFTGNTNSYRQYPYLQSPQQLFRNNNNNNKDYSLVTYVNRQEITGKDELSLEFNLNNTKYNSDYDQNQVINNVFTPFTNGFSEIKNNNFNVKSDYTKKFTDDLKLETGLKYTYKKEVNDYFSNDTSGAFASDYEFKQGIYSYYGTLSYNTKDFRFKPGLRIEYADMRGLVNSSSEFTNYQFDIFPSLTITKYLKDNTQLQLAYGKRIERPRFNALNPFVVKRDIYNVSTGNPDLQPSYTHSFEFRLNKPIDKNYLNANLYLKHSTNLIQNYRYIDSIYTRSVYSNGGYSNEYGIDGGLRFAFKDFWNGNLYGRVGKKIYSEDSLNQVSDRVSYSLNFWGGYSNPDLFEASLSVYIYKQNYAALTTSEPFTSFNLYFSKSFLDKRLYVGLGIDDIFKGSSFENTYIRNGYEQYSKYTGSNGTTFSLNISFTFGNYDEKRQKGKDINGEDYGD